MENLTRPHLLMDHFHRLSKDARSREDWETAQALDLLETHVNNIHHGLPASEWLPRLRSIIESLLSRGPSPAERVVWEQGLATVRSQEALLGSGHHG